MGLPFFFAGRYLLSKKSHNVINVISLVSTIGMAIGTAALILILSVYNGFNKVVDDNLSDFDPDILIYHKDGSMLNEGAVAKMKEILSADTNVLMTSSRLDLEAFLSFEGKQTAVLLRGSEASELTMGETNLANIGVLLANSMGINPRLGEAVDILFLDPAKKLIVSSPASALKTEKVFPSSLFSVNAEIDGKLMEVPIRLTRSLLDSEGATSALEIRLCDSGKNSVQNFKERYKSSFNGVELSDRAQQHPELYKMMRLEKAAVFLILLFVALIVALNIFGSLSMLIIEKKEDIAMLRSMGASEKTVRKIFALEGWMTSLLGILVGTIAGLALALAQERFGFVKMPGNFLVDAYPVVVEATDVIATLTGVSLIGLLVALAPLSLTGKTN